MKHKSSGKSKLQDTLKKSVDVKKSVELDNACSWPEVFKVSNWLIFLIVFVFALVFGNYHVTIVLVNFYRGSYAFMHHLNPYVMPNDPNDQFKYSPFFALIFGMLWDPNSEPSSLFIFRLLNYVLFYIGFLRWQKLTGKQGSAVWYLFIALFSALMDLTLSLNVNQVNAAIIGLTLIGLAEYRDKKFFMAGFILMAATNLKVYPVIFLVALALTFKKKYWMGALLGGIFVFFAPVVFVGWEQNFQTHLQWFDLVTHDVSGKGRLDLVSAFARVDMNDLGLVFRNIILCCFIPVFFAFSRFLKADNWYFWITFGVAALLLLSPRTETFTYVLLAPSYVFLASWCSRSQDKNIRIYLGIFVVLLSLIISLCRFVQPDWADTEAPFEIIRVFGAIGFWILSGFVLVSVMYGFARPRFGLSFSGNSRAKDTTPASDTNASSDQFALAAKPSTKEVVKEGIDVADTGKTG